MGRISRYCTALSRYHKSNGFGIHSPFAFNFVLNVLRERLPYYSYSDIDADRHRLIRSLRFRRVRHQRIISSKNAKMLFRVANYFNPQCIMQIGTNYGMSGRTLLRVSSSSQLYLFEPMIAQLPVASETLAQCGKRVHTFTSLEDAYSQYTEQLADRMPFLLVNSLSADDVQSVCRIVDEVVTRNGVVVMRNLTSLPEMQHMWNYAIKAAAYGMTFSNGKIAFYVANKKLPRQDFMLWF